MGGPSGAWWVGVALQGPIHRFTVHESATGPLEMATGVLAGCGGRKREERRDANLRSPGSVKSLLACGDGMWLRCQSGCDEQEESSSPRRRVSTSVPSLGTTASVQLGIQEGGAW